MSTVHSSLFLKKLPEYPLDKPKISVILKVAFRKVQQKQQSDFSGQRFLTGT